MFLYSPKLACSQAEVRVIKQCAIQNHRFYTIAQHGSLIDLYSTPPAICIFFSRPWNWVFIIPQLPPNLLLQQHVSSIQVENFRYSLTVISLHTPFSLNFAIHTFLNCLRPWRNTILQTRGTFRQAPTRRIRLSFVDCAYSDLCDICFHSFRGLKWIPL